MERLRQITSKFSELVSNLYIDYAGGDGRPMFFEIDKVYPNLRHLDAAYSEIKIELESLLSQGRTMPKYHDLDQLQEMISATENGSEWRVFMLTAYGDEIVDNVQQCPKTTEALRKIPNVAQAFFSILEPGKSVPAHNGPLAGILRYHLGLKVPVDKPPSIRVGSTTKTWEEGISFLFDDTWEHEVYNQSSEIRVVLIVDILRPMPIHLHILNWIYTFVGARIYYGRGIIRPSLAKLKRES